MYIVRDIFYLKFGHYRDAKELLEEGFKNELLPKVDGSRALTDFTGDAYRLIMELPFNSLTEYEEALTTELQKDEWQDWYKKFKSHVKSSHREILKQVM
jgi:hypothetical protein